MTFCNINFNVKNKSDLFKRIDTKKIKIILTANAAFIVEANTTKRFFIVLKNNHVTFDGTVSYLAAKILTNCDIISTKNRNDKSRFDYEKLSGSDIVYDFCEMAKNENLKIFFLGGKKESNQKAIDVIREKYNIEITGYSPDFEEYPFSDKFNNSCIEKITAFAPDILFVGFGAPKQEYWIDDHKTLLSKIGVKYAIGCGGTFDFVSKIIKRAPVFIQKIGFEGLYRFLQEPSKVRWRRLIDSCKFFKYIWQKPYFIK